ncbi:hypothetical protein N7452_001142 [Penicillium brevicompactum]|uniref:Uncharacterized protein n=1 Tax=Penicillium brevicompactum TaxID=5074 RepID=A0A9W9R7F7_PENBR|nr:hypothetical protein N7452_001142 [Penicillium brevicompactum]
MDQESQIETWKNAKKRLGSAKGINANGPATRITVCKLPTLSQASSIASHSLDTQFRMSGVLGESGQVLNIQGVWNWITMAEEVHSQWDSVEIAMKRIRMRESRAKLDIAIHSLPTERQLGKRPQ